MEHSAGVAHDSAEAGFSMVAPWPSALWPLKVVTTCLKKVSSSFLRTCSMYSTKSGFVAMLRRWMALHGQHGGAMNTWSGFSAARRLSNSSMTRGSWKSQPFWSLNCSVVTWSPSASHAALNVPAST